MQDNKVSVKKMGNIHIVYMDLISGKPMKLVSSSDIPEFGFPQTFNSRQELSQAMPGHIFDIFEEPTVDHKPIEKAGPEIAAQVAAVLNSIKPISNVKLREASSQPYEADLKAQRKSNDIITRLEFALQYASLKNQKDIQLRVTILKEAFNEIFN